MQYKNQKSENQNSDDSFLGNIKKTILFTAYYGPDLEKETKLFQSLGTRTAIRTNWLLTFYLWSSVVDTLQSTRVWLIQRDNLNFIRLVVPTWLARRLQLRTDLGMGISRRTCSTVLPIVFPRLVPTWLARRLQLRTDLGMGISRRTCSTVLPIVCLGPTVMSSFPTLVRVLYTIENCGGHIRILQIRLLRKIFTKIDTSYFSTFSKQNWPECKCKWNCFKKRTNETNKVVPRNLQQILKQYV